MKDESWQQILASTAASLNRHDEYPVRYVDALFQKWRCAIDIYDACPFLMAHASIRTGAVAVFQIPIGKEPCADSLADEMNELLADLPGPFSATFWGGNHDEDGKVEVTRPITGLICSPGQGIVGLCIVPPLVYPLEIGYMNAYKLPRYFQPGMTRLARWPYGQDRITVYTEYWVLPGQRRFDQLQGDLWGDAHSLPNPWSDWWSSDPHPGWPPWNRALAVDTVDECGEPIDCIQQQLL